MASALVPYDQSAVTNWPPMPLTPPDASPPIALYDASGRLRQWSMPAPKTTPPDAVIWATGGVGLISASVPLAWKSNAWTYRAWSLTPWVRAAIKIRREQIASADWDIVPADKEGRQNKRLAKRIRTLLETPNAKAVSFHSFVQEVLEDLLVLDAGVFEKVRYPDGEIAELWPTPGEYIAIDPRWNGVDPDQSRYYYVPDGQIRAEFKNTDLCYMMDNPRTISPVGVSPIEILKLVIDAEYQTMAYNRRMVTGAAPNGALNIGEGAQQAEVDKLQARMESQVFGQNTMAIIGGYKNPSYFNFGYSNKDMQFREWEDLLIRCIAIVYGLAPMDLGITFDVNRSSAEQQAENTEDRGLRPLLDLFQTYLTKDVVQDESFGGRENNLKFAFASLNLNETKTKAEINKIAVGGASWKTINEARVTDGRAPIDDLGDENNIFNHILLLTPKGMLDMTTQEYVGEEQLAKLAADAKTTAITAQANADAAQAKTDAQTAVAVAGAKADAAPKKPEGA